MGDVIWWANILIVVFVRITRDCLQWAKKPFERFYLIAGWLTVFITSIATRPVSVETALFRMERYCIIFCIIYIFLPNGCTYIFTKCLTNKSKLMFQECDCGSTEDCLFEKSCCIPPGGGPKKQGECMFATKKYLVRYCKVGRKKMKMKNYYKYKTVRYPNW